MKNYLLAIIFVFTAVFGAKSQGDTLFYTSFEDGETGPYPAAGPLPTVVYGPNSNNTTILRNGTSAYSGLKSFEVKATKTTGWNLQYAAYSPPIDLVVGKYYVVEMYVADFATGCDMKISSINVDPAAESWDVFDTHSSAELLYDVENLEPDTYHRVYVWFQATTCETRWFGIHDNFSTGSPWNEEFHADDWSIIEYDCLPPMYTNHFLGSPSITCDGVLNNITYGQDRLEQRLYGSLSMNSSCFTAHNMVQHNLPATTDSVYVTIHNLQNTALGSYPEIMITNNNCASLVELMCAQGTADSMEFMIPAGMLTSGGFLWVGQTDGSGDMNDMFEMSICEGAPCDNNPMGCQTGGGPPSITVIKDQDVGCYGGIDGQIHVLSGSGILNYSLDGISYDTTSIFDSLVAGNYTVYAREDMGCISTENISIAEPAEMFYSDTILVCNTDSVLVHGIYQSLTGDYYDSISVGGCDSISHVRLVTYSCTGGPTTLYYTSFEDGETGPYPTPGPVPTLVLGPNSAASNILRNTAVVHAGSKALTIKSTKSSGWHLQYAAYSPAINITAGKYYVIEMYVSDIATGADLKIGSVNVDPATESWDVFDTHASAINYFDMVNQEPDPYHKVYVWFEATTTETRWFGVHDNFSTGTLHAEEVYIDEWKILEYDCLPPMCTNHFSGSPSIGCDAAVNNITYGQIRTDQTLYGSLSFNTSCFSGHSMVQNNLPATTDSVSVTISNFRNTTAGSYPEIYVTNNNCGGLVEYMCAQGTSDSVTFTIPAGTLNAGGFLWVGQTNGTGNMNFLFDMSVCEGAPCGTVFESCNCVGSNLEVTSVDKNNASCFGVSDGNFTIHAQGGVGANSYSLDGATFQSDSVFSGLIQGTYLVYIKDAGNCQITTIVNITEPSLITQVDSAWICEGDSLLIHGVYQGNEGIYTDTFNVSGCDSVSSVSLGYLISDSITDVETACDSLSWIDGNTYYSSNNSALHSLVNSSGCDSIIHLDLTVFNSSTGTDMVSACDSFTWIDGNSYLSDNNFATFNLINVAGCDSVVTLNLTITNQISTTDSITICNEDSALVHGMYQHLAGNYVDTFTVNSCDSISTVVISISPSITSGTDVKSVCESLTWIDGNTYTSSNNSATHVLNNSFGCDSTVTLDLTIRNSTTGTDVQFSCNPITWIDGNTYSANNNSATHTIVNSAGCDSIVTLSLTIAPSNTTEDSITICDGDSLLIHGVYQELANTYVDTFNVASCDSISSVTLLIDNGCTPSVDGYTTLYYTSFEDGEVGPYPAPGPLPSVVLGPSTSALNVSIDNVLAHNGSKSFHAKVALSMGSSAMQYNVHSPAINVTAGKYYVVEMYVADTAITSGLKVSSVSVDPSLSAWDVFDTDPTAIRHYEISNIEPDKYHQVYTWFQAGNTETRWFAIHDNIYGSGLGEILVDEWRILEYDCLPPMYTNQFGGAPHTSCVQNTNQIIYGQVQKDQYLRGSETLTSSCFSNHSMVQYTMPPSTEDVYITIDNLRNTSFGSYPEIFITDTNCAAPVEIYCAQGSSDSTVFLIPAGMVSGGAFLWVGQTDGSGSDNMFFDMSVCEGTYCSTEFTSCTCSNSNLISSISVTSNVSCFGESSGAIEINATGGSGNLTYSADGINYVSGNTFTNLSAGEHTFYVSDTLGCQIIQRTIFSEPAQKMSMDTLEICAGTSITIHGISRSLEGEYLDTLPSGGCDSISSVRLVFKGNSNLSFDSIYSFPTSCYQGNDGFLIAIASGSGSGGSLLYSLDSVNYTVDSVFTNLTQGNYKVYVKDTTGCNQASGTTTITSPALVTLLDTIQICQGDSVSLFGEYRKIQGVYSDTLNTSGCDSLLSYFVEILPSTIVIDSMQIVDVSCTSINNGSLNVYASGGYGDLLYSLNGVIFSTSSYFSNLSVLNYTLYVKDTLGCVNVVPNVTISTIPSIGMTLSSTNSDCGLNNGTATVNVTSGQAPYSYSWTSGDSTSTASDLAAGVYVVSIEDGAGCIKYGAIEVNDNNGGNITYQTTDLDCPGDNSGAIDVSVAGGIMPYAFEWSNGAATEDLTNLATGTYLLTVTDSTGCVSTEQIAIASPNDLNLGINSVNSACSGSNGTASVNVTGGTTPYTYFWSTGGTTSSQLNLGAGSYTVWVTDSNSCVDSATISLGHLGGPQIDLVSINSPTCGDSVGAVDISVSG